MTQLYSFPPRSQAQLNIPQDVPVYKVGEGQFYADDELFPAGAIIVWPDEPNASLEPLNDLAREALGAFYEKMDAFGIAASEKTGKAYVKQAAAFRNQFSPAQQEGRRVAHLNGADDRQILGARRGRPRANKVDQPAVVTGEIKSPRGRDDVNGSMGVG
jgi:hypothetical protein